MRWPIAWMSYHFIPSVRYYRLFSLADTAEKCSEKIDSSSDWFQSFIYMYIYIYIYSSSVCYIHLSPCTANEYYLFVYPFSRHHKYDFSLCGRRTSIYCLCALSHPSGNKYDALDHIKWTLEHFRFHWFCHRGRMYHDWHITVLQRITYNYPHARRTNMSCWFVSSHPTGDSPKDGGLDHIE